MNFEEPSEYAETWGDVLESKEIEGVLLKSVQMSKLEAPSPTKIRIPSLSASERLREVYDWNQRNQPTYAELKNRFIFDSYKPMHLINTKSNEGIPKYFVNLK
mmetsp:Transcript_13427/g.11923  ORF Transcript_13427/g.11923 Transcript_13427/m.11923 type:complete len:103 (-) Transcript_13427:677-985(-)